MLEYSLRESVKMCETTSVVRVCECESVCAGSMNESAEVHTLQ